MRVCSRSEKLHRSWHETTVIFRGGCSSAYVQPSLFYFVVGIRFFFALWFTWLSVKKVLNAPISLPFFFFFLILLLANGWNWAQSQISCCNVLAVKQQTEKSYWVSLMLFPDNMPSLGIVFLQLQQSHSFLFFRKIWEGEEIVGNSYLYYLAGSA